MGVGYIAHVSSFTDFGFNAATIQFCNFTAVAALFVPLFLAPALGVTLHLRQLFTVQHRLVFDSPHSRLFVHATCGSKGDLDCHAFSPRMIFGIWVGCILWVVTVIAAAVKAARDR